MLIIALSWPRLGSWLWCSRWSQPASGCINGASVLVALLTQRTPARWRADEADGVGETERKPPAVKNIGDSEATGGRRTEDDSAASSPTQVVEAGGLPKDL